MTQKVLMSRTNENGWKLEDLLGQLETEILEKSDQIKDSENPLRDSILSNNNEIIKLLNKARELQVNTYKTLDAVSPDEGPSKPRL